ncbi:MAG: O-antigen ligase family protein [Clostridia bacterium]|nr:O-antigen ligase family protein [Clostridia bacterium]
MKKQQKKNQNQKTIYYTYNIIAAAGVFTLLCIFPFFVTNGYHNITASKYYFFCISTAFFSLLTAAAYLFRSNKNKTLKKQKKNTSDIFMLIFLAVCVFSCLLSEHRAEAFNGSAGRRMGLVMMAFMAAAYFFISRSYIIRYKEINYFGLSLMIMCLLSVAQYMGADPFSLLADIAKRQRVAFIGLLGNINVFASYLCISVPLFMYLFCAETNKSRVKLYALVSGFGFCGIYASDSDTGILGLAAAFFIVFLFCCKNSCRFLRFWQLICIFSFSSFLFRGLTCLFKNKCRHADTIYSYLLNPWLILAVFCISFSVFLLVRRFPVSEKGLKIIRISVTVISAALILSLLAGVIYFSVFNREMPLGEKSDYLRFDDLWGSERGAIWQKLFKAYLEFPVLKKLIGSGEDTVIFVIRSAYGSGAENSAGQLFDNAHNEPLQYLVTLGLCGLVSYLAAVGTAVKSAIKSGAVLKQAAAICVCVYLVQSLVAITQPITTPLLFVFLGLAQAKPRDNNSP